MAKTWKDKLVKEERKLNDRIDKLASFIEGEHGEFDKLLEPDRDLLMTQHAAMTAYLNVLAMRMKRLGLLDCEECKEVKVSNEIADTIVDMMRIMAKNRKLNEDNDNGRNS